MGNRPASRQTALADSSASSASAPSPPADLEISPLDQGPLPVIADYLAAPAEVEHHHTLQHQPMALPFDLNVFKCPPNGEMGYSSEMPHQMGRARGLSILGEPPLNGAIYTDASGYSHALHTEGFVGEIAEHDEMLEQYIHTAVPVT